MLTPKQLFDQMAKFQPLELIGSLVECTDPQDLSARLGALGFLFGKPEFEAYVRDLLTFCMLHPSAVVRRTAMGVRLAEDGGDPRTTALAQWVVTNDPDPEVREVAAHWLARLPTA